MPTHADLYGHYRVRLKVVLVLTELVLTRLRQSVERNNRQYTACDPAIGTIPCVQFLLRAGSLQKLHVISL